MKNINCLKGIGFGALIWVLMFVIILAFIGFKIQDLYFIPYLNIIIAAVITYIVAGYLKPVEIVDALIYGLIMVLAGIFLDVVITMRFNMAIFASWEIWFSYALVAIVPALRAKKIKGARK